MISGKTRSIVHIAAIVASAIAFAFVTLHVTLTDVPFLMLVELVMVMSLGSSFHISIKKSVLTAVAVAALGTLIGRSIYEILRRTVPGLDFIINSGTAFLVVEILGWLTVAYFEGSLMKLFRRKR